MKYKRLCEPHAGEPVISTGNIKLGRVANLSLTPCASCPKDAPCKDGCYARKAMRMYPSARLTWGRNLEAARRPAQFMRAVERQLKAAEERGKLPRFFRWHVAGDFPSLAYLRRAVKLAEKFPTVRFLAFTKRYKWAAKVAADLTDNFEIVLSAWPGYNLHNPYGLRVAWMQDGTEDRVPEDALECPGNCESCGMCWSLSRIGRDVVFHKH